MALYIKYKTEDNKSCQILKKSTEANNLEITVLFGGKAFKATVREKDLISSAEKHEKSLEDFTEELFGGDDTYTAKISEKNTLTFSKKLENTEIKLKVFEHELTQVNYAETVENLLSDFSEEHARSEKEIKRLLSENEKLRKSEVKYEEELQKLVEKKNTNEEELYSKFVLVLNEKKTQIQHLSQLLSSKTTITRKASQTSKKKTSLQKEEVASSSAVRETVSSSGSETEQEETDPESENEEKSVLQQPSSSSFECDILSDDIPRPKRYKFEEKEDLPVRNPLLGEEKIEIPKLICREQQEESVKEVKVNAFEINTQDLLDSF